MSAGPVTATEIYYRRLEWERRWDASLDKLRAFFLAAYDHLQIVAARVDAGGWPTRDAAAPEEGC